MIFDDFFLVDVFSFSCSVFFVVGGVDGVIFVVLEF